MDGLRIGGPTGEKEEREEGREQEREEWREYHNYLGGGGGFPTYYLELPI
jgi:hypothetical protein